MADEGDILTNLDNANSGPNPGANGADTQPAAAIITQYVKDLSVENPNSPASFQWPDQPKIDVQFNIGSDAQSDEVHEVTLKVKITATCDQGTSYLIELDYCGLVGIRNVPEEQAHAFLFAEAPRILFPFARRVIADAVRDAGFQPLMVDPIDFNGLYVQQLQQRRQQEGAADTAPPAEGNA